MFLSSDKKNKIQWLPYALWKNTGMATGEIRIPHRATFRSLFNVEYLGTSTLHWLEWSYMVKNYCPQLWHAVLLLDPTILCLHLLHCFVLVGLHKSFPFWIVNAGVLLTFLSPASISYIICMRRYQMFYHMNYAKKLWRKEGGREGGETPPAISLVPLWRLQVLHSHITVYLK